MVALCFIAQSRFFASTRETICNLGSP